MLSSFVLSCLLTPALASDVLTVGPGPQADYSTIQSAIDAAVDGAEIRIAPDTYAGANIQGKSLFLTGQGLVILDGTIFVANLTPIQSVVLRGLEVSP